jgi:hypothetical protein
VYGRWIMQYNMELFQKRVKKEGEGNRQRGSGEREKSYFNDREGGPGLQIRAIEVLAASCAVSRMQRGANRRFRGQWLAKSSRRVKVLSGYCNRVDIATDEADWQGEGYQAEQPTQQIWRW